MKLYLHYLTKYIIIKLNKITSLVSSSQKIKLEELGDISEYFTPEELQELEKEEEHDIQLKENFWYKLLTNISLMSID